MDLRHALQEETKILHSKMEQTVLLKKIMLQEITRCEYQLVIQKFYGFIKPCEEQIESLSCKTMLKNREKKNWLEQDLQMLKTTDHINTKFSICNNLPNLSDYEQVLGYLYVMEGATHGGQIITKIIKSHLQVTQDRGGRFFHGYGDKTKLMWNDFCLNLGKVYTIEHKNRVIHSAINTFQNLLVWMEGS